MGAKALFGDLPQTYEVWLARALCSRKGRPYRASWCDPPNSAPGAGSSGIAPEGKARTDFISRRVWNLMRR
jgi:hypothetical protein